VAPLKIKPVGHR